ncbi:MAG: YigZ family protein [Bacilli bacterium]|nr:YigZ family protein [Bacilli bacterium]
MLTIREKNEESVIRDRSEFIGILVHVTSTQDVENAIKVIKEEYPKAKHYCYAYRIGNRTKCSDDGEPSGTAGRPLLDVLEKRDLDEILVVVVRYFGGILLGASRLLSTYIEAATRVIDSSTLLSIENRYIYKMTISYSEYETMKRLQSRYGYTLENIQYDEQITLDLLSQSDNIEELVNLFPKAGIEVMGTKQIYVKLY